MTEPIKEFDCDYQDESVCPYCGAMMDCTYELFGDHNETADTWCGSCGKAICVIRHESVSYTTKWRAE